MLGNTLAQRIPWGALAASAPPSNTLLRGIVAYWKLNEVSGTRSDSVGSSHLADNNTVAGTTGKIGGGAAFVQSSSEYLSIADSATLSTGDIDFTIDGWFYLTDATKTGHVVGKWGGAGAREYVLYYNAATSRWQFYVSSDGTAATAATASTFGAPSNSTWYYICAWHDAAANTLNIQVNNGTVDSTAYSGGVADGTTDFRIGGPSLYYNGRVDEVGFWKRVLTADERTERYNGGDGLTHPFDAARPWPTNDVSLLVWTP